MTGFDTEPHCPSVNFENRQFNLIVSDADCLSFFPRKHEHGAFLCEKVIKLLRRNPR